MSKPRAQVSFDLETAGVSPASAIVSIGAVATCENTGEKCSFYSVCNLASQTDRVIDPSTIAWWESQPVEARQTFDQARVGDCPSLAETLDKLTEWLGQIGATHDVYVWGNGSDFDVAILAHAYRQRSPFVPWNFRHSRDMRTLYDITLRLGLDISGAVQRNGVHHNALDDATYQADLIMESLRQINLVADFIRNHHQDEWLAFLSQQGVPA